MKCHPTEHVRMYFWLETKMQGKQPPGNLLQSYLFLVTKLSFGKTVVHFSLSQFVHNDLYHIQPVVLSSGFLKSSLCKFTVENMQELQVCMPFYHGKGTSFTSLFLVFFAQGFLIVVWSVIKMQNLFHLSHQSLVPSDEYFAHLKDICNQL